MEIDCATHAWSSLLPDASTLCDQETEAFLRSVESQYLFAKSDAPAFAALDEALAKLEQVPLSVWERLRERLLAWLESLASDNETPLIDWIKGLSVPEHFFQGLFYSVLVSLFAVVIVVLWREYRALKQRRRQYNAREWDTRSPARSQQLLLADLEAMPAQDVPGHAMMLVLERLRLRKLVPDRRNLTHRQVLRAVERKGAISELGELAAAAERASYAGWRADSAVAKRIRDTLPGLLRELDSRAV
ncbi:MAG: hypothetical protein AAGI72_00090 [Pseudomonadota bacterium]